jgi:dTDP-glucose 4,6-dehydratase
MMKKTILITGGAGFIGSCFVRRAVQQGHWRIINLDKLTYAGNPDSLPQAGPEQHQLIVGDIGMPSSCAGCCRSTSRPPF